MNKFLTFKKSVKVGDKIYIIVKKLPPIILSGGDEKEYKVDDMSSFGWFPEERIVEYIDYQTKEIYDHEDMIIDDDIVKFDNLADAEKYCYEKNKNK